MAEKPMSKLKMGIIYDRLEQLEDDVGKNTVSLARIEEQVKTVQSGHGEIKATCEKTVIKILEQIKRLENDKIHELQAKIEATNREIERRRASKLTARDWLKLIGTILSSVVIAEIIGAIFGV